MSIEKLKDIINEINNALIISTLDSRISNYIDRNILKCKIKEKVKEYIENNKYLSYDFSKVDFRLWN